MFRKPKRFLTGKIPVVSDAERFEQVRLDEAKHLLGLDDFDRMPLQSEVVAQPSDAGYVDAGDCR